MHPFYIYQKSRYFPPIPLCLFFIPPYAFNIFIPCHSYPEDPSPRKGADGGLGDAAGGGGRRGRNIRGRDHLGKGNKEKEEKENEKETRKKA